MFDRVFEFADPRQIITAPEELLREKCLAISKAAVRFDWMLVFPKEEQERDYKIDDPDLYFRLTSLHSELRQFAWIKSEVRGRIGPDEVEEFWEWMERNETTRKSEEEKKYLQEMLVDQGLWDQDPEGALWCYDLCRDFLSRCWLVGNEIVKELSNIVDEENAASMTTNKDL